MSFFGLDMVLAVFSLLLAGSFFLLPGFLIQFSYNRFLTGVSRYGVCWAVSGLYYGGLLGLGLLCTGGFDFLDRSFSSIWIFLVVFLLPVLLGSLLGWLTYKEYLYRFCRFCRFEIVHGVGTAWDWKFMRSGEQWMTIHLRNADRGPILTYYDENCFVSSVSGNFDLYLSNQYAWKEEAGTGEWSVVKDDQVKGLWIRDAEIERIEFHGEEIAEDGEDC